MAKKRIPLSAYPKEPPLPVKITLGKKPGHKYPQYPHDTLVTHRRKLPQGKTILQREIIDSTTLTPQTLTVVKKPFIRSKVRAPTRAKITAQKAHLQKYGFAPMKFPEMFPSPLQMGRPIEWKQAQVLQKAGYDIYDMNLSTSVPMFTKLQQQVPSTTYVKKMQQLSTPITLPKMIPPPQWNLMSMLPSLVASMVMSVQLLRMHQIGLPGYQGVHDEGGVPSSWCRYLQYEGVRQVGFTGNVRVQMGWRRYIYLKVPWDIFVGWKEGMAVCKTSDIRYGKKGQLLKMRWTVGKTPSVGAFFNEHIKGRYGWVRV